jgi:hypothetical protein
MTQMMRLMEGKGPQITVPDWAEDPDAPTPEQFLDWLLEQNREAQLILAAYHLDIEEMISGIGLPIIPRHLAMVVPSIGP